MNVDRTEAPNILRISTVDLPEPKRVAETPLFVAEDQSMEALRVELIFKAGSKYQSKKLLAQVCSELLLSGTEEHDSKTIAAQLDFYGAFIKVAPGKDFLSVQFHGMAHNMLSILKTGLRAIHYCIFPESERAERLNIAKANFKQSLEKVGFLARRAFFKNIYAETAYDTVEENEDYEKIHLEDIVAFHNQFIKDQAPAVFVSGRSDADLIHYLNTYLNEFNYQFQQPEATNFEPDTVKGDIVQVEKKGAIQNALRMGRVMWTENHADQIPFNVLNTALGGYFGSRLMMNIREDKGYTYGIGSYYIGLQDMGLWGLATEVGSDYTVAAYNEIQKEINDIKENGIPQEELERVKNYMTGHFLESSDGVFAVMEQFKNLWLRGKEFSSLNNWLKTVQNVDTENLQNLANQYLDFDQITVVNAGVPTTFH